MNITILMGSPNRNGSTHILVDEFKKGAEDDGLVTRVQFNEVPPHVGYSLSDMGKDLFPVFYSIMNWGFKHEKEIYEAKEDK